MGADESASEEAEPLTLAEVFDLAKLRPTPEEVARIRHAARAGRIFLDPYSHMAARGGQRAVSLGDCNSIVLQGRATEKDLPDNPSGRPVGIAFEGTLQSGRRLKVKVSWDQEYFYVTVHDVRSGK